MDSNRIVEQLTQFFAKVPQQKLSNALVVLLILSCAALVGQNLWSLVPVETNQGQFTQSQQRSDTSKLTNKTDITDLLAIKLFGDKAKQEKIDKPAPVLDKPAPKTRLNLTLTGLVADTTSKQSTSSVAIIESSKGQDTYGIGDDINGTRAKVHQILIDRVILQVSGRFETLMLDGIEYTRDSPSSQSRQNEKLTQNKPAHTASSAQKPDKQKLDKTRDTALSQSLREQRDVMFDDPKKLLDVIKIRPFRQDGELKGYRLSPGKDPNLFKSVGLKRNDLAVSINGYDLTDMQQALTVMRELKTMTDATITVIRGDVSLDIMLAL